MPRPTEPAALADSEGRFRAAFEQAAVGVAHIGLDRRFQYVNDRMCELLGIDRGRLLARTADDVAHPEDRAADVFQQFRLLSGEARSCTLQKRLLRADGGIAWVRSTVSLVHGGPDARTTSSPWSRT